jgi:hypothetical protein
MKERDILKLSKWVMIEAMQDTYSRLISLKELPIEEFSKQFKAITEERQALIDCFDWARRAQYEKRGGVNVIFFNQLFLDAIRGKLKV